MKSNSDFSYLKTPEEIYLKIIDCGKELPPFNPLWKREENQVAGCQSIMYLHTEIREEKLYFYAYSEALISAGLAALLISFYSGKEAVWILKNTPPFLEELKNVATLTPSRVNGLASLYQRIKKEATLALVAAHR